MDDRIQFREAFKRLTNKCSFFWQDDLYLGWFSKGKFPSSCNLPTGLGKTSVVAIWLIALANWPDKVPRRLVYVVNRRTVVDQTTDEVLKYRRQITELDEDDILRRQLGELAISTLRGQFADNREWSADPSRPAVIVGTVDMIGSRLLFSGYGVGFKAKPLHAGFLGQDVLLVHDEAHLEPAFQYLLTAIKEEQERCGEFRKFHVMELSATSRAEGEVFGLTEKEKNGKVEEVRKRMEAPKALHLHPIADEKELACKIGDSALKFKDSGNAVLIFGRKVEDVEKLLKRLPKDQTEQLTGTLRGFERDMLVRKPIFQRFLPQSSRDNDIPPAGGTVYLVCTSAGEVGVNLSADHLICDLSTFDSMVQRFGRVNRFGERPDTEIHVAHPAKFEDNEFDKRREKTLHLLQALKGDASPKALGELLLKERVDAFAPEPTILPTSDILFDSWSLTTIRGKLPGRPPVEPYLHGLSGWEPPETFVAWREEVGVVVGDLRQQHDPGNLLEVYPLKPHELLRDRSDRVFDHIAEISKRLEQQAETTVLEVPVWLVDDDGDVEVSSVGKLAQATKESIYHRTVILPPNAGGLRDGFLDGDAEVDSETAYDVSDQWKDDKGNRRRVRVWEDDSQFDDKVTGMRLVLTIHFQPDAEEDDAETARRGHVWYWYELPRSADDDGSKAALNRVLWQDHTDDVERNANQIVQRLPLSDNLRKAVVLAARFHDLGKRRKLFQRIIGNMTEVLLAKSGREKRPLGLQESYRHELGSLLDVQAESDFNDLSSELQDLVLHLIAAHHGRARPHFPLDEVYDPDPRGQDVSIIATAVPQRFARLQRKYGRWGLAYLESLLRAADYAASANPSIVLEREQ